MIVEKVREMLSVSSSNPNVLDTVELNEVAEWLVKFGYVKLEDNPSKEKIDQAIDTVKAVYEITEPTIGEQTYKALMLTPRCGYPDNFITETAQLLNKWAKEKQNNLTYCVIGYVNGLPHPTQERIIAESWQAWEIVCDINLFRTNDRNSADLLLDVSNSRHEEFGTIGNVLAWHELPQGTNHRRQLLCKLDLAERWIENSQDQGILLRNVCTHEFGHGLGLQHTQVRGELMFPTYDMRIFNPQAKYDIPSVVTRYGKPQTDIPPLPPVDIINKIKVNVDGVEYKLCK